MNYDSRCIWRLPMMRKSVAWVHALCYWQDLQQAGIRPDGCIVGEPTGMNTIIAHKGRQSYRLPRAVKKPIPLLLLMQSMRLNTPPR